MTQLKGAKAVVTGAASGIGRGLCLELQRRGAFIIGLDRNSDGLERLAKDLGGKLDARSCDLSDLPALEDTAAAIEAEHGRVDVLINNAGVVNGRTLDELSLEDIERTFRINTLAPIWLTRCFFPGMLERDHGHVVTVASAAGITATARLSDYSASKFAAFGFDEALRLELKRRGSRVRTTVVCPFFVNTGMFDGVRTRWPRLLPILEPDYLVARIIRAIERNQPRVVTPRLVYLGWLGRMLPVRCYDWLTDFFGISRSMDEFRGRGG